MRISIDDFGTGYSSLSYLKRFAPDVLKLDRSLVREIHLNGVDRAIVGGTVETAHSLGIRVVAEGVEHAEQLAALRDVGCDEAQGFLFAKPMSTQELGQLAAWQVQGGLVSDCRA